MDTPQGHAMEVPPGFTPIDRPKPVSMDVGQSFVARYTGTRTVTRDDGKQSKVHEFVGRKGPFAIWGRAILDEFIALIDAPATVWVACTGQEQKGAKTLFQYEVAQQVPAGPVLTIPPVQTAPAGGSDAAPF